MTPRSRDAAGRPAAAPAFRAPPRAGPSDQKHRRRKEFGEFNCEITLSAIDDAPADRPLSRQENNDVDDGSCTLRASSWREKDGWHCPLRVTRHGGTGPAERDPRGYRMVWVSFSVQEEAG